MTKIQYSNYLDKYHLLNPSNPKQLPTSEEFNSIPEIQQTQDTISMTKSQWEDYYILCSLPY